MNQHRCPYCKVPLTPFNLRENDSVGQIIFANATIEPGLDPTGLRCTENRSHEFGTKEGRLVEISAKISREYVDHPNPSFEERANDWLAELLFTYWPHPVPLPKRLRKFLFDQLLHPWSVAESWYVAYDPNKPWKSAEEEAAFIAGAHVDEDDGWEEPELDDDLVHPYEDDDWDEEEDEDEAWDEERADQEDRDHGTDFPDDDELKDEWEDDGWEDEPVDEDTEP